MNRDTLWSRMKTAGITQSKRQDCPPDADLKVVLQHAQVSAKGLIDFLCSLDSKAEYNRGIGAPILNGGEHGK